jgi:hypothetical protein
MNRSLLVTTLILAVAASACGVPDSSVGSADATGSTMAAPSLSADPAASALPNPDASASTPGTDPSPTAAGLPAGRFGFNQGLEVTADGLAVRRGPTTSAELAFGAPWDVNRGDWMGTTQAVRLGAGYRVLVLLGPVARDGFDWYEVRNLEGPGTEPDVVQWDVDNDGIYADSAWIAAGDGEDSFVEAVPASEDPPNPPLVFAAGSSGTFLSDPFQASGEVGGTWVLVTDDLAPCDFTVALEPSGERLVSASLIGVYEYGSLGGTGLAGEYRLRVDAGVAGSPDAACNWALALFQSVS